MKYIGRLFLLLLVTALLGCSAAPDPAGGYAPGESERLILYTSHKKEVYEPIVREFEERTGIWVTVESQRDLSSSYVHSPIDQPSNPLLPSL